MKSIRNLFLFAAVLFSSLWLKAQTPDPQFFIVETMKTMPGKSAEYVKAEREIWKKLHQERIKRGLITAWSLYAVRYPSGTDAPYDYVTVTRIQGMKNLENPWGTLLQDVQKILTKEEYNSAGSVELLRNLTNKSVYSMEDFVAAKPNAATPSKYQMVNMMKVAPGKGDDYIKMEKNTVKPILAEMMKTGGRAAWGLYSLMLPNGDSMPFNYVTSDFYDKWEDIAAPSDFPKILAKVHPGMTAEAFEKQIFGARTLVRRELWELIDYTR